MYSDLIARLFKTFPDEVDSFFHACIGIAGEAGEFLDACKKVWVYQKEPDRDNMREELGDLLFYIEAAQQSMERFAHKYGHPFKAAPYSGYTPRMIPLTPEELIAGAAQLHLKSSRLLEHALLGFLTRNDGDIVKLELPLLLVALREMREAVCVTIADLAFDVIKIQAANSAKLLKRYPAGTYSNEAAQARADKQPE